MAERVVVLRVFVASPSDTHEYRKALDRAVEHVNAMLGRDLGRRLELARYEKDCLPGFGDDAQDVVNQSIGDEYDIFIGIMFARFGSPTKRAGSGTEEEFKLAYERFKNAPDTVRIMFYFCEKRIKPSEIDPEQLASVNRFRESLGEKGGLWFAFQETEEFQKVAEIHLAKQVQSWGKDWGDVPEGPIHIRHKEGAEATESPVAQSVKGDDEPPQGLIELYEMVTQKSQEFQATASKIVEAFAILGQRIAQRTNEMESASRAEAPVSASLMRMAGDGAAGDIDEMTAVLQSEMPVLQQCFNSVIDGSTKASAIYSEMGVDGESELGVLHKGLEEAVVALEKTREQNREFRGVMAKTPSLTNRFAVAKARALQAFDESDKLFKSSRNIAREALKWFDELLGQ